MEFTEIVEDASVFPGEYLFHEPSSAIVLCGAFNRAEDFIRALRDGRLMEDKVAHFKKINLTKKEARLYQGTRCKSCKGT